MSETLKARLAPSRPPARTLLWNGSCGCGRLDIGINESHARGVGASDRCPLGAEMDTSQQAASSLPLRCDGALSVAVSNCHRGAAGTTRPCNAFMVLAAMHSGVASRAEPDQV